MNPLVAGNGGQTRVLQPGERIGGAGGPFAALTTAGAGSILASSIVAGFLTRTGPSGGYTDTLPTADAILKALGGGLNYPSNLPAVEQAQVGYGAGAAIGTSFWFVMQNGVAQTCTLAAPTSGGITLVGTTDNAASKVRAYLVEVVNATPPSVVIASALTTQKVYTGLTLAQTQQLSVGQLVYGTNVGSLSKIVSIQQGTGFTVDVNTSGAITNGSITITPEVRITGIGEMVA